MNQIDPEFIFFTGYSILAAQNHFLSIPTSKSSDLKQKGKIVQNSYILIEIIISLTLFCSSYISKSSQSNLKSQITYSNLLTSVNPN
jgi:hypothetical protein